MTTLERPTTPTTLTLPAAVTDPEPPRIAEPLFRARAALAAAAADYRAIPEAAVTKRWLWRGLDHGDGVRYGIYRGAETIDAAAPARPPKAESGRRVRGSGELFARSTPAVD